MASCYDCIHCGACSDAGDSGFSSLKEDVSECKHFKDKADVVDEEKVAEILADVTGIAPCEMVGNEWLFDCCEHIGYCYQASDSECWMQYLKHYKERSE